MHRFLQSDVIPLVLSQSANPRRRSREFGRFLPLVALGCVQVRMFGQVEFGEYGVMKDSHFWKQHD
jgi:hypothetical protein